MKKGILFFLIFYPLILISQVTPSYNIYYKNKHYYNPAEGIADTNYQYHLSVYGKNKFVNNDVWTKPMNMSVNHIGHIEKISSFYSASYQYDGYSFFDRHTISTGFGYQWKLPHGNQLSFGLRGVFNFDKMYWDRFGYSLQQEEKKLFFTPDLDAGISYRIKGFNLGFAVKNIIGNRKKVDNEELIKNQREWIVHTSYDFDIKQKVVIAPFAQMIYERNIGVDIGLFVSLFKWVDISYMFRALQLRHVYTLSTKIYQGFYIGASVDHSHIYKDINLDFVLGFNF